MIGSPLRRGGAHAAALLLVFLTAPASGQMVGPPKPLVGKTTPAEQAMALYAAEHGPRGPAKPCRPVGGDTITVCGSTGGGSAYRLPLPDERAAFAAPAHATGDAAHVGVGRSPKETMPNTGLRLTLAPGRTSLKGLGER